MIVHRLLDAVFRTLDTVDAIRARVDAVLGRADAQPPSSWPPVIDDDTGIDTREARAAYSPDTSGDGRAAGTNEAPGQTTGTPNDAATARTTPSQKVTAKPRPARKEPAPTQQAAATAATATTATKKTTTSPAQKATTKKAATKKPTTTATTTRKGSVDRLGKDLDSPRATQVANFIVSRKRSTVAEDAVLDGKRTIARVLWALAIAEQAGIDDGLTAVDASALLSTAAHVEVFSTNVARAFRDEHALFAETTPDGRSKRYALTAAGRARLAEVTLR